MRANSLVVDLTLAGVMTWNFVKGDNKFHTPDANYQMPSIVANVAVVTSTASATR